MWHPRALLWLQSAEGRCRVLAEDRRPASSLRGRGGVAGCSLPPFPALPTITLHLVPALGTSTGFSAILPHSNIPRHCLRGRPRVPRSLLAASCSCPDAAPEKALALQASLSTLSFPVCGQSSVHCCLRLRVAALASGWGWGDTFSSPALRSGFSTLPP